MDVERAHGLPGGRRQHRVVDGDRTAYRDVDYEDVGAVVELDGSLATTGPMTGGTTSTATSLSVVGGDVTVRVGWRQMLDACRLAVAIVTILQASGWPGEGQEPAGKSENPVGPAL